MILIDKLCYGSGLRYTNASEKFAFSLVTLGFCVVSRSIHLAGFVLLVMSAVTVGKGKIPLSRYLRLMCIPLVFLLFSTVAILVNLSKTPLDAFAIPIGSFYLTGSKAGLHQGIQIILTALASVSCLYFLSLSTPMTDILEVLRQLHTPQLLLELMLLIYRYIFILLESASAISTAQAARLGHRNVRTALQSFSTMVSSVFVLSIKRANALYTAMESRCYDDRIPVLPEYHPAKAGEILWIVGFEFLLLALTLAKFGGRIL
jgi:cobalt/nickel transport system permease protein